MYFGAAASGCLETVCADKCVHCQPLTGSLTKKRRRLTWMAVRDKTIGFSHRHFYSPCGYIRPSVLALQLPGRASGQRSWQPAGNPGPANPASGREFARHRQVSSPVSSHRGYRCFGRGLWLWPASRLPAQSVARSVRQVGPFFSPFFSQSVLHGRADVLPVSCGQYN